MAVGVFSRRVEWGETDSAAIIYYPTYYRWFDEASHELFRTIGYPLSKLLKSGHSAVLAEASARFRAALRYDDRVVIHSQVTDVRTRTFRVEHVVRRQDLVVCDGYEIRVWVHLEPGGTIVAERIPDDIRHALSD